MLRGEIVEQPEQLLYDTIVADSKAAREAAHHDQRLLSHLMPKTSAKPRQTRAWSKLAAGSPSTWAMSDSTSAS
ncbi:MAG: hypothetical protein ABJA81_05585 [Nocardioidaceae bacterium]